MDESQTDPGAPNPLVRTHRQRRRCEIQLAFYGSGAPDALIDLQLSLQTSSVRASLRAAGIGLHVIGDIVEDDDKQRDTVYEPAAIQDLHLYWVASINESLHPIDTVTTTETLEPPV
jgi:hypothetical protein